MFEFEIKNTYKKAHSAGSGQAHSAGSSAEAHSKSSGQARTGFFNTPHGKIKTPNLAIVATHGKIKLLNKTDEQRANPDLIIANTFHLFVNDRVMEIKKAGGLHKWSGFKKPIMTDSGGFQVFSLGWGKVHGIGKVGFSARTGRSRFPANRDGFDSLPDGSPLGDTKPVGAPRHSARKTDFAINSGAVEIDEDGVDFIFNGKKYFLTPEKSIKIQQDLGADIIFAFDECTSLFNSYSYTKKAMSRTHRWAIRCLNAFSRQSSVVSRQSLFGIVQGGIFEDLRKKSSRFIGSLPFEGFGIGGCFGEKQMPEILDWSLSYLPEEKPRHLLGIGKIKDIFTAVKKGIDLFDCVIPTREARHGVIYTKNGKMMIKKEIFSKDKKLIDKNCRCWVCRQKIAKKELREYFKTNRILGQRLATIHNIYFFKNLFKEIREAIASQKLDKLEKEYYNYLEI